MKQLCLWSVRWEWQTDRTEADPRETQRQSFVTYCYNPDKESIHNGSPVMCVCVCVCVFWSRSRVQLSWSHGLCLPGSSVHGILQAKILEWVVVSFSNAWKWKVKVKLLSHVRLLATTWTAAHQAPPSVGFSRQEYWSGVPLPSLQTQITNM